MFVSSCLKQTSAVEVPLDFREGGNHCMWVSSTSLLLTVTKLKTSYYYFAYPLLVQRNVDLFPFPGLTILVLSLMPYLFLTSLSYLPLSSPKDLPLSPQNTYSLLPQSKKIPFLIIMMTSVMITIYWNQWPCTIPRNKENRNIISFGFLWSPMR